MRDAITSPLLITGSEPGPAYSRVVALSVGSSGGIFARVAAPSSTVQGSLGRGSRSYSSPSTPSRLVYALVRPGASIP